MTTSAAGKLSFSVIVASRHRISWLRRCLAALRQLDYPEFEIVVVADRASLAAIDAAGLKTVPCDTANLSLARNLGLAVAGGDVFAFIDDDAVAEPLWLRHFEDALQETGAAAVAGFVRGRNGISFQSRAGAVDGKAETHEVPIEGWEPCVPVLADGQALKLVGTNMAVRRGPLEVLGGFDESYRYFLEDSDLSMRLMKVGAVLAVAPLAQVHHGFAASSRRTALRAPLDLFDIGRSTAIYLRRHLGQVDEGVRQDMFRRERARLVRHMVAGTCEPRHVDARMAGLMAGWQEGCAAVLADRPGGWTVTDRPDFAAFPPIPSGHEVLAAPLRLRRAALVKEAEAVITSGRRASVFSFSLTYSRHHVRYTEPGFWLQTGGVHGRSGRDGAPPGWCRFADRLRMEIRRVAKTRGIVEGTAGKRWDHTRGSRRDFESEDTP